MEEALGRGKQEDEDEGSRRMRRDRFFLLSHLIVYLSRRAGG